MTVPDAVPLPMPQAQPAPRLVAAGTPSNTVWIWLVVVAQAAIFVFATVAVIQAQPQIQAFLAEFKPGSDASTAVVLQREAALFGNPWYLGNLFFPFVACGTGVLFAALDRKALLRRGYDRPFHWAWAFLGVFMYACSLVYAIGRTIVVRRRGGRGIAPMVVSILVHAVGFAVVMVGDFLDFRVIDHALAKAGS